jgi:ribosomal protein S18 acetylase RimI-like enzyme
MYYKINLNNYEPKKTRIYLEFDKYKFSPYQLEAIKNELNNFQDSFGKPWKEWDMSDLKYRLENNFTFYLIGNGKTGELILEGWAFIDWNRQYPHLCNRYVCPQFRNSGLGNDLVWLRCNEIKKQGYDTAMIHMADWNTPAKSVLKENIFTKMD